MGYVKELRTLVGHRPLILPVAGVLIIDETGGVLLQQRRANGEWALPGGVMELGESLEDTARRKVREETGLELGSLGFFKLYSGPEFFHRYGNGDEVFYVMAMYEARERSGELRADPAEIADSTFFSLDALPDNLLPVVRPVLDDYRRRIV